MATQTNLTLFDGSSDFSGGVNSLKVTTIASDRTPTGLARNELGWLVNATVRDGGITQRTGWQPVGTITPGNSIFQGASIYEPDSANPYIMALVGGNLYQIDPDFNYQPKNLTAQFPGTAMPVNASTLQAFFCQGELFLIIQAGDNVTLPLFWDGTTLRISKGITNTAVAPGTPGVNEIPAATCMAYYQGRLWYAQQRTVSAGDIVGGASGTLAYDFRDAILNVTESPLVVGGDGFTVPSNAGNIRALSFLATLDTSLGQGNLIIFTRKSIYSLYVPVTRADWIATTSSNQPLMTVIQRTNGGVSDRSVVAINGDLFFQSLEPAIRSVIAALRYFQQWANPPVSANETRILQFVNRALMHFGSGVVFDNRLLQATLPTQKPQGVINQAILPLDFTPLSTLQQKLPPTWEGHYEGLDFLQLLEMDFGGRERCFGIVLSRIDQSIQLWELTDDQQFENGDNRVTWQIEFPAYTFGDETLLKKLTGAEFWLDSLFGTVDFQLDYRPDGDVCWHQWMKWQACSPRNSAENVQNPVTYPLQGYGESYRATQTIGVPPNEDCQTATGRPAYQGYQFQPRLTIKGWCRIRSITLFAELLERELYAANVCPQIVVPPGQQAGGNPPNPTTPVLQPSNSVILPATGQVVDNGLEQIVVTVYSRDQFGQPFTKGGAKVVLNLSGPGTLTTPVDQGNGQYVAVYTAPLGNIGTATITGTMNGKVIGSTFGGSSCVITVVASAADAAHSIVTPATASIQSNGITTTVVTVTARNSSSANIGHGGDNVVISLSGSGTISATQDNGDGTYTATVTSPYLHTGTASGTVTATLNGATVGTISGQSQCAITFTVQLPDVIQSTVVATSPIIGNGSAQSTITINARDSQGVAMSGQSVLIGFCRPNGGNFSFLEGPPYTTDGSGQLVVHFTSTVADTKTIYAGFNGGTGVIMGCPPAWAAGVVVPNQSAPIVVNPQNPNAAASSLNFTAGSSSPTPHGTPCSFTAVLLDPNNNPVPGATLTGTYGGIGTIAYPNGQISDNTGTVIFTVSSAIAQGPFNVNASWSASPWTGGGGAAGNITNGANRALTFT